MSTTCSKSTGHRWRKESKQWRQTSQHPEFTERWEECIHCGIRRNTPRSSRKPKTKAALKREITKMTNERNTLKAERDLLLVVLLEHHNANPAWESEGIRAYYAWKRAQEVDCE